MTKNLNILVKETLTGKGEQSWLRVIKGTIYEENLLIYDVRVREATHDRALGECR